MNPQRVLTLLGFLIGAVGLVLQFAISIPASLSAGRNLADALITFFTYYTILTNLTLVLIYLSDLTKARWLGWFRSARTRAMMAGAILLVMLFYHALLASLWSPEGVAWVADTILHYVTPIFYIIWWWIFADHGKLARRDVPLMLVPSLIYIVWVLLRGAVVAEYPYPVFNVTDLGYPQVLVNIVIVAVVLAVFFACALAADRYLARSSTIRTSE
ncbi:MAG: Pr6Pr family membrane protein [Devosia nanyangense]|nr:Pr6Pr family membrane protein [Devosia nanyangense]